MNDSLKKLKEYQDLLQVLTDLESELTACNEEVVEAEQLLEREETQLREAREKAKMRQVAVAGMESELGSIEEQTAKLRAQLNTVKKQAEYDAITSEIRGLEADKSKLEDDLLKHYTESELAQAEFNALKGRAKIAEDNVDEARRRVQERVDSLKEQVAAQRETCKQKESEIAPRLLSRFLRLHKHHGGKAMVPVTQAEAAARRGKRGFVCRGCNTNVTLQQLNLLLKGEELVFCLSCGRIQYLEAEED